MEHDTKEASKKNEAYLYKREKSSWGSLISLLVVISVIILGAFYAWGKRIEQDKGGNQNLPSFEIETSGGL